MAKAIYYFSDPRDLRFFARLDSDQGRALLGGKGAGLFEMARLGLPVPPGLTITTEVCRAFYAGKRHLPRGFPEKLAQALKALEKASGRGFGSHENPLLVSVRSGSKHSMPGMMDTILNLGLNDRTVLGLEAQTGDPRFALDCYRRFLAIFGSVVKKIEKGRFESALRSAQEREEAREEGLSAGGLQDLAARFQEIYREETGSSFPQDPWDQLLLAVTAVFDSWNNPRAMAYRSLQRIPDSIGTACTVQAMVFGNMGPDSGTGVAFTRDPASGAKALYGEYLANAQGEDVVSGTRTPQPLAELERILPGIHARLSSIARRLERHYRDVQDMEFTLEKSRLYMLQTRTAKRTAIAALRCAVDMAREGLIPPKAALMRLRCGQLDELLRPVFDSQALSKHKILGKGLAAAPGAASGRIALSAAGAEEASRSGPVILVRPETSPDDIRGMIAAQGILTATGGLTSHAAVVGRGLGKVCVVGCGTLVISEKDKLIRMDGRTLREGDFISLDGFRGEVIEGEVSTKPSEILQVLLGKLPPSRSPLFSYYETFMSWADRWRTLEVRANADTPEDAVTALALGASGIGLCRTEHMFFRGERIAKMLAVILARTREERSQALQALYPLQKADFKAIFRRMRGLPVTIRTLDPPLHEFLPRTREETEALSSRLGCDPERVRAKAVELREANPMLGHRGCRLGITYPEITEMQVRAIVSAACELRREGIPVKPEIMIPLVGHVAELKNQRQLAQEAAREALGPYGLKASYSLGTMIEVPRAALTAAEIAREAEFFSFGTNDLTQMTLGYSRDDYGRYLPKYLELKILEDDPFQRLDRGVGRLVRLAIEEGRRARPGLKVGVCGEHGGDPASIAFFHEAGADYVSCSPYRVPVARLACAQAAISLQGKASSRARL